MPINWIQYPDSSLFNTDDKIIVSEPSGNTKNLSFPFTSNSSGITFTSDIYFTNLTEAEQEFSVMVGPDGKLYKSTHPGERSRIQIRNGEGATIPAGAPIYSKGEIGGSERISVGICDSGDPAKMPCIGIVETELNTTDNKDGFATTQGVYNTNISGFTGLSEGDILYVNGGSAPHLTQTKPTNGDLIQNVGVVLKTNGTKCQGLLVAAIGRTNDVPWPLYVDHANQRVGIGTATPTEKLHVDGNILISRTDSTEARLTINTNKSFGRQFYLENKGNVQEIVAENTLTVKTFNNDTQIILEGGSSTDNIQFITDESEGMRLTSDGYLGIGLTNPSEKLSVNGNIRVEDEGEIYIQGGTSTRKIVRLDNTGDKGLITLNRADETKVFISSDFNTHGHTYFNGLNTNVGIGTSSPQSGFKLDINGASVTRGDIYLLNSINHFGTGDFNISAAGNNTIFKMSGSEKMRLTSDGKLGVGTSSPQGVLDLSSTAQSNVIDYSLRIHSYGSDSISRSNGILFNVGYTDYTRGKGALIYEYDSSVDTWNRGDFHFLQNTSGNSSIPTISDSVLTIKNSGNVGIGTTSPSEKLDVSGNVLVGGGTLSRWLRFKRTDGFQLGFGEILSNGELKIGGTNVGVISFYRSVGEVMRINGANVLIGTTTDTGFKLNVSGSITTAGGSANITAPRHMVADSNAMIYRNNDNLTLLTYQSKNITFMPNNSESVRFLANGNLLIGTTTDNGAKLQVSGDSTIYSTGTTDSFPLVVGQANAANNFVGIGLSGFIASNGAVKAAMVLDRDGLYGVGDIHFLNNTTHDNSNATLTDSKLVIKKSGNVLIGTTTDSGAKLNVQGSLQVGVDDTGYDVTFYGATSGRYLLWDESANALRFQDNTFIKLGTGDDLNIYHDGSNAIIYNSYGDFNLSQTASGKDIILKCDNGAGGTTAYITLDGSQQTINLQKTVLIGTTTNTGAYKIDVAGKQRVQDTLELDDVLMLNQISTPADPAAGKSVIYMDSADGGIKCKINVGGTVVTRTLASFE